MIKYPNGSQVKVNTKFRLKNKIPTSCGNRGMSLEDNINNSNQYYKEKKICLITKRPTPINVVKVDYSKGAIITQAYFEKQSTTDYNGIYKAKYMDFEAKSTKSRTSFPMSNISLHQIKHLTEVIYHGGIAFFIIEFATYNQVYLLDAKYIIDYYNNNEKHSISYMDIQRNGVLIKQGYYPRLEYIDAVNEVYFCKDK